MGNEKDSGRGSCCEAGRAFKREACNIVLIGMPGCGKTTLGKRIACCLNRPLLDTDALVPKYTSGRSPSEIIASEGEPAFRRMETEAVREAMCRTGCIIATGGGVVTREENVPLLRQNSIIFFIERPLELLELGNNRPLSMTREQNAVLYARRLPLYERICDYRITNLELDTAQREIINIFNARFAQQPD